jgi:hypothetical protein
VRDRVVDQRGPRQGEQHVRRELHALGVGARDQRRRDDGEHALEHHEEDVRDGPPRTVHADAVEEGEVHAADQAAVGLTERQRVADHHPLQTDDAEREEGMHERREDVLALHHAAIEKGQARCHQHDQRGGNQHPRRVASIDFGHRS